jgi:hypothetical protein
VVRNNVLVVLCDICRTFTDAVSGQIEAMTACLRDSNEVESLLKSQFLNAHVVCGFVFVLHV